MDQILKLPISAKFLTYVLSGRQLCVGGGDVVKGRVEDLRAGSEVNRSKYAGSALRFPGITGETL